MDDTNPLLSVNEKEAQDPKQSRFFLVKHVVVLLAVIVVIILNVVLWIVYRIIPFTYQLMFAANICASFAVLAYYFFVCLLIFFF